MRGKVSIDNSPAVPQEDHPRLCGEKLKFIDEKILRQGSPPPMRGKARVISPADAEIRITPAYAGKSPQSLYDAAQERDHPRLCGEKTGTKYMWTLTIGSPPPMRGKV